MFAVPVLFAGWLQIRDTAVPALEEMQEKAQGHSRIDCATVLYTMEHHVPLVLLGYNFLLREGIKDDVPGASPPAPTEHTWLFAIEHMCVIAFLRQRKNYTGAYLGSVCVASVSPHVLLPLRRHFSCVCMLHVLVTPLLALATSLLAVCGLFVGWACSYLDTIFHWKRSKNGLYEHFTKFAKFYDEAIGKLVGFVDRLV